MTVKITRSDGSVIEVEVSVQEMSEAPEREPISDVLGRLTQNPGEAKAADVLRLLEALEDANDAIRAAHFAASQSDAKARSIQQAWEQYKKDAAKPLHPGQAGRIYVSITSWQGQYAKHAILSDQVIQDLRAYTGIDMGVVLKGQIDHLVLEVLAGWVKQL